MRCKVFALAVSALVTGCIPAPVGKYYKPMYPSQAATYVLGSCHGRAGAPVTMTFPVADGVTVTTTAHRTYAERDKADLPLVIRIDIPKGVTVQFVSDDLSISDSNRAARTFSVPLQIAASRLVAANDRVDFNTLAPTGGAPLNDRIEADLGLNFAMPDFAPAEARLELPAVVLQGDAAASQPVVFEAKAIRKPDTYPGEYRGRTSLVYLTKETERSITERYLACRRDTPRANCDYIPLYLDVQNSQSRDGFEYEARMYVYNLEEHTPFTGQISVRYSTPRSWKFASGEIRVTDASGNPGRSARFKDFALHLRYAASFRSEVRGVNDAPHAAQTSASIVTSLGTDEPPSFHIRLPPMKINGVVHVLKPIELERRLFDVAVMPFNC